VLLAATSLGVVLMLVVFTLAPLRQFPGTSVALMNLRALIGRPCGLAPAVRVFAPASPGLGAAAGPAELGGDTREGPPADLGAPPGSDPGIAVWNTKGATSTAAAASDNTGTGTITTPWYPVPAGVPGGRIVVPLVGDLGKDQRVAVEVGTGNPAAPSRVVTKELDPLGKQDHWTEAGLALADTGLRAPTAVRVVAEDRDADPGSWLAVAAPRLTVPRPVTELIGTQPVFADQVSAGLWACQHQIALRDGLAEAPAWRLRAADGLEGAIEQNSIFAPNGGTLVQVDRTATFVELPSELVPPGVPTLGWGHVERVVYRHPVGLVDVRVDHVRRSGWTRLPTLAGEPYTGRIYIG
jgi:arabinosyltransferase B/arabinosyltransferase C